MYYMYNTLYRSRPDNGYLAKDENWVAVIRRKERSLASVAERNSVTELRKHGCSDTTTTDIA